jgi:hypothetical protein
MLVAVKVETYQCPLVQEWVPALDAFRCAVGALSVALEVV